MNPAHAKYLDISYLTKTYPAPGGGTSIVVKDFNLAIARGEFVSIIGHSGCGKSTVLSIVAGLNDATEGGVIVDGREIEGAGPDRGVVFQAPCLLPWLTVEGNVRLGVDEVHRTLGARERAALAKEVLVRVGLGHVLNKHPAELSSGMKQRVGLARAFAIRPKVLLLDEPFGMLDSLTRFELQEALVELWTRDRTTALMVTHDVDEALFLSDRIVMMTNGPAARVGEVLEVPFPRPRERTAVIEHPEYYRLRERLIGFLEEHATHGRAAA
jgi:nitrate ABC transporter ATP-binding subunit